MRKGNSGRLLGLNLVLVFPVVGLLLAWDRLDLAERLSAGLVRAVSRGIRIAGLAIVLISLAGLILEIRADRRQGSVKARLRWAAHLVAPLLLLLGVVYSHVKAAGPVSYDPPSGATYACEEVRITLPCGDVLAGSLTMPRGAGPGVPAMVLITGSSPHDRDNASPGAPRGGYRPFRQIAHRLSSRGIAVLRMDDRGVGRSVGGDLGRLTTAERAEDIEAGIAFLRRRPNVDGARIGLLGLSEGVSIAHMIAAHDGRIRALVLLSGIGSPGKEVLRYQVRQGLLSEDELAALLRTDENTRFLNEFDPLITARMIRQPVLILHGDRDRSVPYTDAFRLEKAIRENGNRDVTVRILAGYNHPLLKESPDGTVASARLPDEVLDLIQNWLAREL